MLRGLLVDNRETEVRILLTAALLGCVVWLALTFFRLSAPNAGHQSRQTEAAARVAPQTDSARKLEGDSARAYLERTNDGQPLMNALEVERFGLKWQHHSPFKDEAGSGYLGLSHDENLNAWFDDQGATIRPTLSEKDRDKGWSLALRLESYGYGDQLIAPPPIVSRSVKDAKIEYARDNSSTPQSEIRNPKLVEWYVNKSEGIEQGFTLNDRPAGANGESIRLVLSVKGELQAHANADGQSVELTRGGKGVLTYGHLLATDANRKQLIARMETNALGDEIALIVNDDNAEYPITVDPITATLKQKLDASNVFSQQDARFGFAVAIDGNTAVVGAWREDDFSNPFTSSVDAGAVYVFNRTISGWSAPTRLTAQIKNANDSCGWSVAIRDSWLMFGCPGADNNTGKAVYRNLQTGYSAQIDGTNTGVGIGARLGTSIVIGASDGNFYQGAIGAPLADLGGQIDVGAIISFGLGQGGMSANWEGTPFANIAGAGSQFGASLATDGTNLLVGEPNAGSGTGFAVLFSRQPGPSPSKWTFSRYFPTPTDGINDGVNFANSVALTDNIAVFGAPLDDTRGVDAGAAYVYVRDSNGVWSSAQRLTASDAAAGDHFSENALAIEGNTIVVGAYGNGAPLNGGNDDDRGAAYIFTRSVTDSGSTWTQQAKISPSVFQGGEAGAHFGISVDISGTTVLIGARAASAGSTASAGAAFSYELDCVAPYNMTTSFVGPPRSDNARVCPGASVRIDSLGSIPPFTTFQWRKQTAQGWINLSNPNEVINNYDIKNATAADAGVYDVIVGNKCGTEVTNSVVLSLHTFSLNLSSQNIAAAGSNGVIGVSCTGTCPYSAVSNDSWITITSGGSGNTPNTVGFTVAANSGSARTGTLTIAGQTFTVNQDGAAPSGPTIFIAAGTVNEASAIDSVTFARGPFRVLTNFNFSVDRHTRVMIFTSSLGLTQPDSTILSVQAAGFPLTVENVGPVTGVTGLSASYIIVRLPDGLPTGDLPVTVTLRGVQSGNAPTIRISP